MTARRFPGARIRRAPLACLALVLALSVAACGGDRAGSDASLVWEAASADASPRIYYPPTVQATSGALRGNVEIEDPEGDIAGPDGAGSAELPEGLDLVRFQLEGDGTRLMARWYTTSMPPRRVADGSIMTWRVDIWQEDEPIYQFIVELAAHDWSIYVRDGATGDEAHFRLASLYQDRMEAPFPASDLTRIDGPFTFAAEISWVAPDGSVYRDTAGGTQRFP